MEIKNIVLLVIFILGIVYIQFVNAETADDIINKYIDARGGKAKLNSIKSLYMEGFREMMGSKIPIKVTIVQGKLHRTDFDFEGIKGYMIVTPTIGWSFIPMRSESVEILPEDKLKLMQEQMDIQGPLFDHLKKGNKAKLQAKDFINGIEVYKLSMHLHSGKEATFYFDMVNYLLLQSKQYIETSDEEISKEIITSYSDYKSYDGVLFPETITNSGTGIADGITTYNTVVINKEIIDDQYKPSS